MTGLRRRSIWIPSERPRRTLSIVAACFGVLAIAASFVTTARAVTGPAGQSMTVTPSTVVRGHPVTVSGTAPHCQFVTLLSNAFPRTNEFAGVPAVQATSTPSGAFNATVTIPTTVAPATYTITARACGGNLGIAVSLRVTTATVSAPSTGAGIDSARDALAVLLVGAGMTAVSVAMVRRRLAATSSTNQGPPA